MLFLVGFYFSDKCFDCKSNELLPTAQFARTTSRFIPIFTADEKQ